MWYGFWGDATNLIEVFAFFVASVRGRCYNFLKGDVFPLDIEPSETTEKQVILGSFCGLGHPLWQELE